MADVIQLLPYALAVNFVLGTTAFILGLVSRTGYVGGVIIGVVVFAFGGIPAYIILWMFYALGTVFSRYKYEEKKARGSEQEEEGRRGSKHALANCIVGVIFAILSATTGYREFMLIGLVGAFATALSDTTSNELGQIFGKSPVMPLTFRQVEPGTEGAVSVEGTLLGIGASFVVALVAYLLGIVYFWYGVVAIMLGAFIGTTVESLLSATRFRNIGNEFLNLLNTAIGGVFAILIDILIESVYW
jgi:uncharacterized protein (TIGR00297 family)